MALAPKKKTQANKPVQKTKEKTTVKTVFSASKETGSGTKKAHKPLVSFKMPQASSLHTSSRQTSPDNAKLSARVQAVVDKTEIAEVVFSLSRGLDRLDETLLRSVWHMDATVDLGPGVFQGAAGDYIYWVMGVLQNVRSSHHMVGNVRVDVEGDVAFAESYMQTYYRLDKPTGKEDVFLGGRFLDRFERRPAGSSGAWKIMHRKQVLDWARTEMASELFYHQNPDALWSYRTKTDVSYQMANFPGSQNGGKLPSFLGRRYDSRSMKL